MFDDLEPLLIRASGDPSRQLKPNTSQTIQESINCVPPYAPDSSNRAHLFTFEDSEAGVKMVILRPVRPELGRDHFTVSPSVSAHLLQPTAPEP